jgi:hypothetical protein
MSDRAPVAAPRLKNRRGAMLVMASISIVALLGLVAIATDIGSGNHQKRIAQTAADAGAIGGGRQLERKLDSASVIAYAITSTGKNGFSAAETSVFYPPATGNHVGDMNYVEVVIAKPVPTLFGRIFNRDTIQVRARAVAGLGTSATYCLYNFATAGIGVNWDGKMETNCGVVSNASLDFKKGITAPYVAAVGTINNGPGGKSFPGTPPVFDPFTYLTVPAETTCDFTNKVVASDALLDPGVYCGGITVNDNILATLKAGVYIIRGGGLKGGQIEATAGVTIINTNGPGNDLTKYKPITFGNNCKFHVFAPSSGTYKGIAVLTPTVVPAAASATDNVNDLCGKGTNTPCDGADPDIRGIVYMPNQAFRVSNSNGKLTVAGTLITKYMTSSSGATGCFFLDASGNSPLKTLSLVE